MVRRILELYVAGDNIHSRRAKDNLDDIVGLLGEMVSVEVIDVIKAPAAAFARRIFATPALIAISDEQTTLIIGDLSDRAAVLHKLGVSPGKV
ncbi:MAG TPA: circadian clock KaiB family protein [Xanthobacteraceae bacterium]|nr:circadian clock KaiB family protein [Xanthobacteraceae bacterium]